MEDIGLGKGKLFTLNVPYKGGINDAQFVYLFERWVSVIALFMYCTYFVILKHIDFEYILNVLTSNAIYINC